MSNTYCMKVLPDVELFADVERVSIELKNLLLDNSENVGVEDNNDAYFGDSPNGDYVIRNDRATGENSNKGDNEIKQVAVEVRENEE
ncbi:hypothetical protein Trydic_g13802 [Trypoxylus dichotomus]